MGIKRYLKGEAFQKDGTIRPHTHSSKADSARLGTSVAISDRFIVVGAPGGAADNQREPTGGGITLQGYVEVFEITDDKGIKPYTTGTAFDRDTERKTIRPHTHPIKDGGAYFGWSVAISDRFIVVGARWGQADNQGEPTGGGITLQGYVEVFEITDDKGIIPYTTGTAFIEKNEVGAGTIRPHTHPSKDDGADFGHSVAINDKFIVVGAPQGDADNNLGDNTKNNIRAQGYIEVFEITDDKGIIPHTTGTAFIEKDEVGAGTIRPHTYPSKEDNDNFGWSVTISGNFIVVGAPGAGPNVDGAGNTSGGKIGYVEVFKITDDKDIIPYTFGTAFEEDDGTIRPHDHGKANQTLDGDNFGNSVAISGNFIVVGATGFGGRRGTTDEKLGYVEVFKITDDKDIIPYTVGTAFEEDGTIRPHPSEDVDPYFGHSVAISDRFIVVGAYYINNEKEPGYVEVFEITSTGIKPYTTGTAFIEKDEVGAGTIRPHTHPINNNANFGESVAINDKFIVVGASGGDADNTKDNVDYVEIFTSQGYVEVFNIELTNS